MGRRLRALREDHGLSLQNSSPPPGRGRIDHDLFWMAEKGRTSPSLSVLESLAAALGVELEDLTAGHDVHLPREVPVDAYKDFRFYLRVLDLKGLDRLSLCGPPRGAHCGREV